MPKSHRHVLGLCIAGSLSLLASGAFAQEPEPLPEAASEPSEPAMEGAPPAAAPPATVTTETTTTQTTTSGPSTTASTASVDTVPTPELKVQEQQGTYVSGDAVSRSERAYFPNRPMLATGIAELVVGYVPAAIVAAAGDHEGDEDLYYPVAGPWMYLAREDHDAGMKTLLVLDGVLQDLGALMILTSFVVPETRRSSRWYGSEKLNVMPRFARHSERSTGMAGYSVGLGARGRF